MGEPLQMTQTAPYPGVDLELSTREALVEIFDRTSELQHCVRKLLDGDTVLAAGERVGAAGSADSPGSEIAGVSHAGSVSSTEMPVEVRCWLTAAAGNPARPSSTFVELGARQVLAAFHEEARHAAPPPVDCPSHNPIQHRDMKPPWCPICGLTEDFQQPEARPGPPPARGG